MITGDNPITSSEQDLLDRGNVAQMVADLVTTVDASEGFVAAVNGTWGSGKTSVINLACEKLGDTTVIRFNPWMFSGAEDLVGSFFRELSVQLKADESKGGKFRDVADTLLSYGELLEPLGWIPVAGSWLSRVGALSSFGRRKTARREPPKSAELLRVELADILRKLDERIVVVIDDIDRLQPSELQDVFKLVRLVGALPNVVYLLAFDRAQVEKALGSVDIEGHAYLEKIVQLGVDVPDASKQVLLDIALTRIDDAVAESGAMARFDKDRWPDVFAEIISPVLTNMRDAQRFVGTVTVSAKSLAGHIDMVDLLAIEAIRTCRPQFFRALVEERSLITTVRSSSYGTSSGFTDAEKSAYDELVKHDDPRESALRKSALERLFPATDRFEKRMLFSSNTPDKWRRQRRLASLDVLTHYIERVMPSSISELMIAETVFESFADESALRSCFDSVDDALLLGVVTSLSSMAPDFSTEMIVPASRVLLDLESRMTGESLTGFFSTPNRWVPMRVVNALFDLLGTSDEKFRAADEVLNGVSSLSSKLDLVLTAGCRENFGAKWVEEKEAEKLEKRYVKEFRKLTVEQLATEWEPLSLLYRSAYVLGAQRFALPVDNQEINKAVLLDGISLARRQRDGTRNIRISKRLQWQALVDVYGDEDRLKEAIETLRSDAELTELVALCDKYLARWRPDNLRDDEYLFE